MTRRFSLRCGECRQKTMVIATVPYDISVDHDGKRYDVHLPAMTVPKCTNCGALSLDDSANEQIDTAFRKMAGLLLPSEILQGRIDVGFPNQQEFAKCIGVSAGTVSRWENGSQVQQRFHDGVLRGFFQLEEFRAFLAELHGVNLRAQDATEITGIVFNCGALQFAGPMELPSQIIVDGPNAKFEPIPGGR